MRSGFVTLVGRPNAGKSTLLNRILGTKVSIVSNKPQTTRNRVMGALTLADQDAQIVFVDTPGIHKPVSPLGERLNETATGALADLKNGSTRAPATGSVPQWMKTSTSPLEKSVGGRPLAIS